MQIGLESIPQVPMLRQGALIHRVDNWVQSKVWKPEVLFVVPNRQPIVVYIFTRLELTQICIRTDAFIDT